MSKRKTNKPKVQPCMAVERTIPKRRSIPVNEVEQIVDRAVKKIYLALAFLAMLQWLFHNQFPVVQRP